MPLCFFRLDSEEGFLALDFLGFDACVRFKTINDRLAVNPRNFDCIADPILIVRSNNRRARPRKRVKNNIAFPGRINDCFFNEIDWLHGGM